jgi:transposase
MIQSNEAVNNFVGIDISKKGMEVIRICGNKRYERIKVKTNYEGVNRLLSWLKETDTVSLEAGSQAFRIAKRIKANNIETIVLNPGELRTIYGSLRKTDREDSLKLARLVQRHPREELPEVVVPSDEEEDARRLATEQSHWSKQNTMNKNRLHSIFTQAGLTDVSKKDISTHSNREKVIQLLTERFMKEALRLHKTLDFIEMNLAEVDEEINERLKRNKAYVELAFSMPGFGPVTTHALLAYVGDCSRFSSGSQVSYYTGLVPRVDQSGETVRYGKITKRGCLPIRRVIIQCAWSLVKSEYGGDLRLFFEKLSKRVGKKKAIVATARKMVEVFYSMIKNGDCYRGVPEEEIYKKMKRNGLIA